MMMSDDSIQICYCTVLNVWLPHLAVWRMYSMQFVEEIPYIHRDTVIFTEKGSFQKQTTPFSTCSSGKIKHMVQ